VRGRVGEKGSQEEEEEETGKDDDAVEEVKEGDEKEDNEEEEEEEEGELKIGEWRCAYRTSRAKALARTWI
jgi:hypothetical protein